MAGLTTTGFEALTLQEIKTASENDLKASFGQGINLAARSRFGQLVGIFSKPVADLWELGQAIVASLDPDEAEGAQLDAICGITGTVRLGATKSKLSAVLGNPVTVSGTNGTVIGIGDLVLSVVSVGTRFVNTSAGTISGGVVSLDFEAEQTGPLTAPAGTLTVIQTPISGVTSATNSLDAVLGRDRESDPELRVRREDELRGHGLATLASVRSAVLAVPGVTSCSIFENVTLTTDGDGVPGKSFEAVVLGGAAQDIRNAILASKPAGIATHGSTTGTATDAQGVSHEIDFSRPTLVPIYVTVNLKKTPTEWPADGVTQVQNQLLAYEVDKLLLGANVVASAASAYVFRVLGVDEVEVLISTAPAPTLSTTIPITPRQLADLDTSRMTVNPSDFSP